MFKYFMPLMSQNQQTILKTNHYISINEYKYEIDSLETINDLKQEFLQSIINNNKLNKEENLNYIVSFIIDNKVNISISIFNRDYIIELLESINKFKNLSRFDKLSLS